jgi:hypothetical protein
MPADSPTPPASTVDAIAREGGPRCDALIRVRLCAPTCGNGLLTQAGAALRDFAPASVH